MQGGYTSCNTNTHYIQIFAAYDELSKAAPYERQGTTLEIQKFSIADNHTCVENTGSTAQGGGGSSKTGNL